MIYGNKLEQVLHCASEIQNCNDHLKASRNPLYTAVGVMDWVTELHRVMREVTEDGIQASSTSGVGRFGERLVAEHMEPGMGNPESAGTKVPVRR